MRTRMIVGVAVVMLAGCGQVSAPDEPPTPTTARGQVPAPDAPSTTTARVTVTTISVAARSQANAALCAAVKKVNEKVVTADNFADAKARLGASIAANEQAADAAVLSSMRDLLAASVAADIMRYGTAFSATTSSCAKAGHPFQTTARGPIRCVRAPCP